MYFLCNELEDEGYAGLTADLSKRLLCMPLIIFVSCCVYCGMEKSVKGNSEGRTVSGEENVEKK